MKSFRASSMSCLSVSRSVILAITPQTVPTMYEKKEAPTNSPTMTYMRSILVCGARSPQLGSRYSNLSLKCYALPEGLYHRSLRC